jgi:hypothetical protein
VPAQNLQIYQQFNNSAYQIGIGTTGGDPNFQIVSNTFSDASLCLLTIQIVSPTSYLININGNASVSNSSIFLSLPWGTPANIQYISSLLGMYISEMILYKSKLTKSQYQLIEGYLAWKWGLNTSLPTNHPYYTI